MQAVLIVLAALVGGIGVVQTSINGQVRVRLGDPWHAALFSTMFSTLALLILATVATGKPLPDFALLAKGPWYLWLGGLMGALYVGVALVAVTRIGSMLLFALIIFGQLVTAMLMEHYGVLGLPKHEISAGRLLGVALLFVGVVLIRFR